MKIFQNELDPEICRGICGYVSDQLLNVSVTKTPVRMWTNYAWPETIVKDSATVFCFVTPPEFLKEIQMTLERLGIFDPQIDTPITYSEISDERSFCLIYVWTPNSYIPLHTDGKHRKTVTVYCNESWSYLMGGVFQWFDKETNRWESLIPSRGTVILNDRDESHATTPVKTANEFRVSLQIFLFPKNPR